MITKTDLENTLCEERLLTLQQYERGIINKELAIGKIGGLQRVAMKYHLDKFTETTAIDFYQLRNNILTRRS